MKKFFKRRSVIVITVIIILLGIKYTVDSIAENMAQKTLGVGAVHLPKDGDWNIVDVSGCKISTVKTDLVNGIWLGPWDGTTKRTLAPDMNAVYFQTFLPVLPLDQFGLAHFEIKAEYPESRFMSYHLYSDKFVLEGDSHKADYLIKPDQGSVNPFISGYDIPSGMSKDYTLKIVDFNKIPAAPNENVFYGGEIASGAEIAHHALMLRYYDPKRAEGKLPGIVERGQVLFKYLDTDPLLPEIKENPCKLFSYEWYGGISKLLKGDSFSVKLISFFKFLVGKVKYPGYLPDDMTIYDKPEWIFGGNMMCTMAYMFPTGSIARGLDYFSEKFSGRKPSDYLKDGQCGPEFGRGAFNYDNRYIYSFLDATRGSAVMRMKNMNGADYGQDMTKGNQDVRYWSICLLQLENLMYVNTCLRDDEVVTDPEDNEYVTFIFTKENEKPDFACDMTVSPELRGKDCKYNWLPYVSPITWLYVRTLVGNPDSPAYDYLPITYNLGTGNPNDFTALKEHMGEYYPEGEYCSFNINSAVKYGDLKVSCENVINRLYR